MLKKLKLILLLLMVPFSGKAVSANYEKLAYDFKFENLEKLTESLSGETKMILLEHGKDLLDKTY